MVMHFYYKTLYGIWINVIVLLIIRYRTKKQFMLLYLIIIIDTRLPLAVIILIRHVIQYYAHIIVKLYSWHRKFRYYSKV